MPGLPDFLQMLRMKNLFGPNQPVGNDLPSQGGITGSLPNSPVDLGTPTFNNPRPAFGPDPLSGGGYGSSMSEEPQDIASQMGQLYTPNNQAETRLNEMMGQFPERNKPGALRRIAAVAGAVGGHNPDDILYAPYNRQLTDWKNKFAPALQTAQLERQSNVNERTAANQTIANQLRQDAQLAKMQNDTRRAEISEHRARVYEYKVMHPEHKIIMTKGGNVMAFDPATNQTLDLGIPSGSMTDADKLQFSRDTTMKGIAARGGEARKTAEEQGDIESGHIEERGAEARTTKAAPSGATGANKPELPSQTKTRLFNKATEAFNTHPEWKKYIKLGTNDFKVSKPSWGGDDKVYKDVNDFIYGRVSAGPTTPTGKPAGSVVTPSTKDTTPPKGAKPGGKWIDTKYGKVYQEP